jgi:hypothetical protein
MRGGFLFARLARIAASAAPVAAVVAVGVALAPAGIAGASGRVTRITAPERIEVFVPGGRFQMGVDEDSALVAVQQCELAYPAVAGTHPGTGKPVGFCSVDYESDLVHMQACTSMPSRSIATRSAWPTTGAASPRAAATSTR